MIARPAVGWADLLLAIDRLAADSSDVPAIGAMLGIGSAPEPAREAEPATIRRHSSHVVLDDDVVVESHHSTVEPVSRPDPIADNEQPTAGRLELKPHGVRRPARDWKAELPADLPGADWPRPSFAPVFEPLFEPRHEHQIILQMVKSAVDSTLNAEALVDHLARHRLPRVLPRRRLWVVNRPIQVLADMGDGMLPFAQDRGRLIQRLKDLVGTAKCSVTRIDTRPPTSFSRSLRCSPGPYRLPAPGAPILVISDFSLGGFAEATVQAEWRQFADLCRGCNPVTALVPRPQTELAALPEDWLTLAWDRATAVATICRRRSSARESGQ